MSSIFDAQLTDRQNADVQVVSGLSPFFQGLVEREDGYVAGSFDQVNDGLTRDELNIRYNAFLSEFTLDPAACLQELREREMIRIVFRDLTRRSNLVGTTAELSHLADFCVNWALAWAYSELSEKYGTPLRPDGEPEQLIVIAMGKLGAFELNLSSDIDLIFMYENSGTISMEDSSGKVLTVPDAKVLTHQEFFLRLSRRLISLLDDAGAVKSVFRVDMRLRPYGEAGPIVLHRAAMEKYYLEQGRDWERYAFIKARVIAGDHLAGKDFLNWLKPFVYRRHLDYVAIQSLREMKRLIARQVELKQMTNDLKLGPGGIREIEFIAQAHQLIWGGRHPDLQEPALLRVLLLLASETFLPQDDVQNLVAAYTFLRNSEHAIQAEFDRQTHLLPDDDVSRQRLSTAMGFKDYDAYLGVLDEHRALVMHCFSQLVAQKALPSDIDDKGFRAAWDSPETPLIAGFKSEVAEMVLDDKVIETVDDLMPRLLHLMAQEQVKQALDETASDELCTRLLGLISAVLRRSIYLVFLQENPDALSRVVRLVAISHWVAEKVVSYPILLFELTDRAVSEVSVTRLALEGELREAMRALDPKDLELQMDTLRQFKLAATMKIAAMELLDEISIMQASDGLTALAEVILDTSTDIASGYLQAKHGLPCDSEGQALSARLAIVAYGKAGGLELAYGSDLDLVFLCPNEISGSTDGPKPVNNNVFYVRLGQRIIHILTRFTRFGILYSVDMRLRPQGNKGPLVATIGSFERYQQSDAWTWEHQALIRARCFAGDREIGDQFVGVRERTIQREREPGLLLSEVCDMRDKMRVNLASPTSRPVVAVVQRLDDASDVLSRFDLKHDAGAIVDIEFMVQYAVLAHAAETPALSRWTDVMRLLDELGQSEIFSDSDVDTLQRAYLTFRTAVHEEWLGLPADFERLQSYRDAVQVIWHRKMLQAGG